MNNFEIDLEYSIEQREGDRLDSFYKKIFPGIIDIEFVESLSLQKNGIDKILHFNDGRYITIDEKKRRKNYGDILIEYCSVFKNNKCIKPGWVIYSKCEYIVYAIMPSKIIYLLPTILLQKAWRKNRNLWFNKYGIKRSQNSGYETLNIAIPPNVLLDSIKLEIFGRLP